MNSFLTSSFFRIKRRISNGNATMSKIESVTKTQDILGDEKPEVVSVILREVSFAFEI